MTCQSISMTLAEDVEHRLFIVIIIVVTKGGRTRQRIIARKSSQKKGGDQKFFTHCACISLNPCFSGYHSKKPPQSERSPHSLQSTKYFCFQSEIDATQ